MAGAADYAAVVVAVHGATFDRADLALAGLLDGTWPAFELAVADGLACERAAGAADDDPELIRDAAVAFRRARGLVAGDQLRAWLAERRLTMDDWTAFLRRSTLRARYQDQRDEVRADHPVASTRLPRSCWPTRHAMASCEGARGPSSIGPPQPTASTGRARPRRSRSSARTPRRCPPSSPRMP